MSQPSSSDMEGAIERVYQAFERYAAGRSDGYDLSELRMLPYRDLSDDRGAGEFKRFLPDLLKSGLGEMYDVDPQVGRALRAAEWWTWPDAERESIREFFRADWRRVLEESGAGGAEGALCGIANLEDDLSWYLEHWMRTTTRRSYEELGRLVLWAAPAIQSDRPRLGVMWEGRERQWKQVVHWLARELTLEHLETGHFATESGQVSNACEALRTLLRSAAQLKD